MTSPTTALGDGGAAFPKALDPYGSASTGMSLRDWFAGHALAGVIASEGENMTPTGLAAQRAYGYADAMLAARLNHEAGGATPATKQEQANG